MGWGRDVQVQCLNIQDSTSLGLRAQAHFVHTMRNANLLFARDIHHIKRKKFTWQPRKCHVQMNLHSLPYTSINRGSSIPSIISRTIPRDLSTTSSGRTVTRL